MAEKGVFLSIFKQSGRNWERLQEAIPSKTMSQIKTYYQNYKGKLGLERIERQLEMDGVVRVSGRQGRGRRATGACGGGAAWQRRTPSYLAPQLQPRWRPWPF